MTNPLKADRFRDNWLAALHQQFTARGGARREFDFWEGATACKELRKRGYGELFVADLYVRLLREVSTYRSFAGKVVAHNRDFKETIEFLTNAERRFLRERTVMALPYLKWKLTRLAGFLAEARTALEKERESYWKKMLFARPDERSKWCIKLGTDPPESIPPETLVEAEKVFRGLTYREGLEKLSDLDARFEIRLGAILRDSLPKVSLLTISRLVVLCYICADLAEERGGRLAVKQLGEESKRNRLTVDAVYQKLRHADLK